METNLVERIEKALDIIRPYLQQDEGDVSLIEVTDDMLVKVRFVGACSDCHINYHTFRNGIETTLRQHIPEIKQIIAYNEKNELVTP